MQQTSTKKYQIVKNISSHLFRAYDIRGIVKPNYFDENSIYTIALAIGTKIKASKQDSIVIARDGRLSANRLNLALIQGLLDTGLAVIDIGPNPTPVLYFSIQHLKQKNGVILTGSHNPKDYNGLKIVLNNCTLSQSQIQELLSIIKTQSFVFNRHQAHYTQQECSHHYCTDIIKKVTITRPIKVVIDCGNGIAGNIAPQLYTKLGCEVIPLYCEVDGNFPNHHPDPTRPENLRDLIQVVNKSNADIGLAFDGDADRLGVVTNTGKVIYADQLIMVLAKNILQKHPGRHVVYDVKCSRHLHSIITQAGGKPLMWQTGHSIIKAKMLELSAVLAGEMSGHIFFNDDWYGFDDGIFSGARLLSLLNQLPSSDALFSSLPQDACTPELLLPVAETDKFNIIKDIVNTAKFSDAKIHTIDGLRVDFEHGWALIRASNTTPNLTLRFEASNQQMLASIQSRFQALLTSVNPSLVIPISAHTVTI